MSKQHNCVSELPENLRKSLENIAKREGFHPNDMQVFKFCTRGGNYLGELYEVNINKIPSGEYTLSLFVKKNLPLDNVTHLNVAELFYKEMFIYNELAHLFDAFQNEANVPSEQRFKIAKSYVEYSEDAIILENLTKKGFVTLDRMEGVTLDFAEFALKQLARYHAFSFIAERKKPDFFNSKIKSIKHPFIFNEHFDKILSIDDKIINYLDDNLKVKVKAFLERSKEVYRKGIEDISHKSVLCHGDYRSSNILTRLINGQISKVVPVDYQIIYYGSPLTDFFYFIFTSTDQKLRRDHLDYLKEIYYGTMKDFVARFGMDNEEVFSREEFERSYKDYLEFGLAIAFIMTPFIFAQEDGTPKFNTEWSYRLNDKYKDRILGVVLDFVEWGIL